jgi:hypothetical protein
VVVEACFSILLDGGGETAPSLLFARFLDGDVDILAKWNKSTFRVGSQERDVMKTWDVGVSFIKTLEECVQMAVAPKAAVASSMTVASWSKMISETTTV